MGKRILSAIIMTVMLAAFVPCVYAAEIVASGECGADGANVTWTLDADGVLTISGSGEMKDYWEIDENGNKERIDRPWEQDAVKKVVIENGVTKIGANAFFFCRECTEVVIADTVTHIGDESFLNMEIVSIDIPDGVTYIGELAFAWTALESVVLPDSITCIGEAAFYMCVDLKDINIPPNIKMISGIFDYCAIESVYIPAAVEEIGYLFGHCDNLKAINVDENNKNFSSVDGVLFNKEKTELYQYPIAKEGSEYTVPEGVEYIGWGAFEYTTLAEITFPESLKVIDKGAFWPAHNLRSIHLPSKVESIAVDAFSGCTSLAEITVDENNEYFSASDNVLFNKDKTMLLKYARCKTDTAYSIPSSVKEIARSAFGGNENLTRVSIPHGVTRIEQYTFGGCTSLTEIYIPSSVRWIDANPFGEDNETLTDIYYYGTQEEWDSIDCKSRNPAKNAEVHIVPTQISDTTAIETENGERVLNAVFENVPVFSKLITVFYSNGILTDVKTTEINTDMINSANQKIPVPEQADSAKVFIWNGLTDISPLCASKEL